MAPNDVDRIYPSMHALKCTKSVIWQLAAMPSKAGTADQAAVFVDWIKGNGGFVHDGLNMFAKLPNGDRGIVAKTCIKEGEQLLMIPQELCLFFPDGDGFAIPGYSPPRTLATSPAVQFLNTLHPKPSNFMSAVLLLLAERALGGLSRFGPYIDMLPPQHDSLIAWHQEELDLLRGTGKSWCVATDI